MAGTHNITIREGETFRLDITWKDHNGEIIDLTGYTATFTARRRLSQPINLQLTDGDGITLGASILITIPAAQTGSLDFNTARYQLDLVSPAGDVTRLLVGRVEVRASLA